MVGVKCSWTKMFQSRDIKRHRPAGVSFLDWNPQRKAKRKSTSCLPWDSNKRLHAGDLTLRCEQGLHHNNTILISGQLCRPTSFYFVSATWFAFHPSCNSEITMKWKKIVMWISSSLQAGRPLPGPWNWEAVPSCSIPSFYHSRCISPPYINGLLMYVFEQSL